MNSNLIITRDAEGIRGMYMTKHFKEHEFGCRHCGEVENLSTELLAVLELVRLKFGKPVTVTSGYRCKVHNDNVGSTDASQHRLGTAADIVISGVAPHTIFNYLDDTFPNQYGLGLYSSGFVHIDVRSKKARW